MNNYCGHEGDVCEDCALTGKLCLDTGGDWECSPGVTCGSANCPNGCCQSNTCLNYILQSISACGKGGVPCKACNSTQTCNLGSCN
jgi:hypothetical protein